MPYRARATQQRASGRRRPVRPVQARHEHGRGRHKHCGGRRDSGRVRRGNVPRPRGGRYCPWTVRQIRPPRLCALARIPCAWGRNRNHCNCWNHSDDSRRDRRCPRCALEGIMVSPRGVQPLTATLVSVGRLYLSTIVDGVRPSGGGLLDTDHRSWLPCRTVASVLLHHRSSRLSRRGVHKEAVAAARSASRNDCARLVVRLEVGNALYWGNRPAVLRRGRAGVDAGASHVWGGCRVVRDESRVAVSELTLPRAVAPHGGLGLLPCRRVEELPTPPVGAVGERGCQGPGVRCRRSGVERHAEGGERVFGLRACQRGRESERKDALNRCGERRV
ncbi:hypothetical protein BD413DRAFT_625953, partial [Trametes elegans]